MCVCVHALLISSFQRVGLQIAFVWSISLAIYSLSERAAMDWAEMRHGFIRPPLHFTPIPFAPYYFHLTLRKRARVKRVCVLCVIMFYFQPVARASARKRGTWVRKKERWGKGKDRRVCPYDTAITPHAGSICTLLCVSLLEKKQVIYQAWRGIWSVSLGMALCVFVCVCVSLVCLCASVYICAVHPFRQQ